MWPVRVSTPGPLTYESGALPTALHGPEFRFSCFAFCTIFNFSFSSLCTGQDVVKNVSVLECNLLINLGQEPRKLGGLSSRLLI